MCFLVNHKLHFVQNSVSMLCLTSDGPILKRLNLWETLVEGLLAMNVRQDVLLQKFQSGGGWPILDHNQTCYKRVIATGFFPVLTQLFITQTKTLHIAYTSNKRNKAQNFDEVMESMNEKAALCLPIWTCSTNDLWNIYLHQDIQHSRSSEGHHQW